MSILVALPIAPLASQIHRVAIIFLALVLLATTIYNLVSFPFSPANPLKVYFQQSVDLDAGTNNVQLVTVGPFTSIYNNMPSAHSVNCTADPNRLGLSNCAWSGPVPNVTLDSHTPSDWVTFTARRLGPNEGEFSVQGRNTRSCRIYSDTPIISLTVDGGHWERDANGPDMTDREGFTEARLWSRTWDKPFNVHLTWAKDVEHTRRTGRVACEWAEWDMGKIPALDELKTFLPPWAVVSKLADGLVEGVHAFELR
jgi:hypothetical protein